MEVSEGSKKKKRKKLAMIITIIFISMLGMIAWVGIEFSKVYNTPELIGVWVSSETGKEVEFTDNGSVIVDKIKTGAYTITSPGFLLYDIEDHTFEMTYKLEGRELLWGIKGEEEEFARKGF